MSTIVHAGSSAEFLALVPHLLECTPRRSLAIVTFAGGRSLGALRVDLPDPALGADVDSVASTVIGMACKVTRTDAIAAVVYTDARLADADDPPHGSVVDALRSRAEICGLRVTDALVVGADGWDSYLAPSAHGPHPLEDIESRDLPSSPAVGGDQFSAVALPETAPETRTAVARRLSDVESLISPVRGATRLPTGRRRAAADLLDVLSDPPALFEATITSDSPADIARLAALSFCLQRPLLRDVALMQWVGDLATGDATYGAQCGFAAGWAFPADLARAMWGEGAQPDGTRLLRALDACRQVAATTPLTARPGPLAACAWLAWATGRSTHAAEYAAQALAIDPDHGLAAIVRTLADRGHLPEWVFERPATTSPAGRESSRGSRGR